MSEEVVNLEAIHDKLYEKYQHQPLTMLEVIPAMVFLRTSLGLKTDNMHIIETYNASGRIAEAYSKLHKENSKRENLKKRNALTMDGSSGSKAKNHSTSKKEWKE